MNIPYLSFQYQTDLLRSTLQQTFTRVLDSGWYIMGKELQSFEERYAAFNNTHYAVGLANGLDALIIALRTLGIGAGDEVIVPSNTYIATWLAVSVLGGTIIPVEPDEHTYNIHPGLIEEKITDRTKAIIPVHLYGQACDMDAIMAIARKHYLYVIEDNAQAHLATWNGRLTGSFGHINATSFYPGKNFGAYGDGGAITTDDAAYAERVKILRNYGSAVKYYNEEKGYNSRLDELQAALLQDKLPFLKQFTEERTRLAQNYMEALAGVGDVVLPYTAPQAGHVYHVYVIRTGRRNELAEFLQQKGVGTLIHYPIPPHLQLAYKELGYQKGDFPLAEKFSETMLSLPLYPGLSEAQQLYIIDQISNFYNNS